VIVVVVVVVAVVLECGGGSDLDENSLDFLFGCELLRVRLLNAEALEPLELNGRERVLGDEAVVQIIVLLVRLVEGAGVDGGSNEVVGCRDGVYVTRQVKVELVHWNHLLTKRNAKAKEIVRNVCQSISLFASCTWCMRVLSCMLVGEGQKVKRRDTPASNRHLRHLP
jgi:hypothetical protein